MGEVCERDKKVLYNVWKWHNETHYYVLFNMLVKTFKIPRSGDAHL